MLFFDHHLMIKVNNIFQFYFYNVEIFSRCTRREREFAFNISFQHFDSRERGDEETINSRGRSRLLDAKFSRDISRSRIVANVCPVL